MVSGHISFLLGELGYIKQSFLTERIIGILGRIDFVAAGVILAEIFISKSGLVKRV